ncbi:MAG: hypothetical protein HDS67_02240 [Bacteroidales bacterium]|nr:hypothetical protein [Bacteroidales bacterium]
MLRDTIQALGRQNARDSITPAQISGILLEILGLSESAASEHNIDELRSDVREVAADVADLSDSLSKLLAASGELSNLDAVGVALFDEVVELSGAERFAQSGTSLGRDPEQGRTVVYDRGSKRFYLQVVEQGLSLSSGAPLLYEYWPESKYADADHLPHRDKVFVCLADMSVWIGAGADGLAGNSFAGNLESDNNTFVSQLRKNLPEMYAQISRNGSLASSADAKAERAVSLASVNLGLMIEKGQLLVLGYDRFAKLGLVPYLLCRVNRRNPYRDRGNPDKKPACERRAGWHVVGSRHTIRIGKGRLYFSTIPRYRLHEKSSTYSASARSFLKIAKNRVVFNGHRYEISENKRKRFTFALAFGLPHEHGKARLSPANMITPLIPFEIEAFASDRFEDGVDARFMLTVKK